MNNLQTINERIHYVMERGGYNIGTFARKCGVKDPTMRAIVNDEGRMPSIGVIRKIIEAADQPWCDANWLILGRTQTNDAADSGRLLKIIEQQQDTIHKLTDLLSSHSRQ